MMPKKPSAKPVAAEPVAVGPIARVVHVGDLHLHADARQSDRLAALDQVVHEGARVEGLVAWAVPGDLFHRRSSVEDRNALKARVMTMADAAPVLMTYGNHDAPGDLDIFGDLRTRHQVYVWQAPGVQRVRLTSWHEPDGRAVDAAVFALPYPTPAGLVSRGVPPDRVAQEARAALEAIFLHAADAFDAAVSNGDLLLMIGHVNVAGAVTSVGQPIVGQDIEIDGALLGRLGRRGYKALNHIHRAQQVSTADYAGSLCRLDWGEVETKVYKVAEYERDADGWWTYARTVAQPIIVPPMYHVECWLMRGGVEGTHVTAGPGGADVPVPTSWAGCDVRVRARYKQSEGSVLEQAQAAAKALFAGARRLELEPVCVPDRGLRAPQVAVARTIAEKLAAWAEVAGAVLPDDAARVADLLDGPQAEQAVADVEAALLALANVEDADVPVST